MTVYHLAQLNVARAVAPLDGEQMADFMNSLEEINGLGETSPGFVWCLKLLTDNGPTAEAFAFKQRFEPAINEGAAA